MPDTSPPISISQSVELHAPWFEPRGLYVHVPFCAHHCGYCDFAVTVGQDHLIETYLEALALEIERTEVTAPLDTIFIGGGTPTLLAPAQLERLGTMIRNHFPTKDGFEFSIESTPESITAEKVAVLADHGLNRFSLGVQSFQGRTLKVLERLHSGDQVTPAVELIRRRVPNFSMDFIFGAPGQTADDWEHDLNRAVSLGPKHVSSYGLTYEKGTPLWKQREKGSVIALDESDELTLYTIVHDLLASAGYEHYEISNFARPGRRCRHNEKYWANEAYHGVGVGAVRYVGGRREHNRRNTKDYIRVVFSGESPTFQQEELSPFERAGETLAVQLRRSDGVSRPEFLRQTGYAVESIAGHRLEPLVEAGLVTDEHDRLALTFAGKCVADGVVSKVVWGG